MTDPVTKPSASSGDVLLKLADRCEREEPSRELDVRIWSAVHPDKMTRAEEALDRLEHPAEPVYLADVYKVPWLTSSLDAAVTLIADGSEWQITNLYGIARAEVDMNIGDHGAPSCGEHKGAVMALALCAAALRARAAIAKDVTK